MIDYILSYILNLKFNYFLFCNAKDSIPFEKKIEEFDYSNFSYAEIFDRFSDFIIDLAFRIIIAIIVFYIGKFIIKRIYKFLKSVLIRRKIEPSISAFILSLLKIVLLFLLIIIVISILGIETSSFIAIFASAGVAIGMALSGTLQNFAGGVLVLLIKPYKVGDFIEAQNYSGVVKEIQIFYTVLNTVDNKSIIIPNGNLANGTINNFSKEIYRRVEWKINIAYGDDINIAKKTALEILYNDGRIIKEYTEEPVSIIDELNTTQTKSRNISLTERIMNFKNKIKNKKDNHNQKQLDVSDKETSQSKRSLTKRILNLNKQNSSDTETSQILSKKINRAPFIAIGELSDSSINLVIRAWTKSENYWSVYFDINEKIYTEFPKAGLNFPFPQMDLHIKQNIK